MENDKKGINAGDTGKQQERDKASEALLTNPGLKDDEQTGSKGKEHPLEEKKDIERASEDRLSEAE